MSNIIKFPTNYKPRKSFYLKPELQGVLMSDLTVDEIAEGLALIEEAKHISPDILKMLQKCNYQKETAQEMATTELKSCKNISAC